MKKTIKNARIVNAYKTLDGGKYSKMDASGRSSLTHAMRIMRRTEKEFEELREDALKRFKPEGYEEVEKKVEKVRQMPEEQQLRALNDPEYATALAENKKYWDGVNDCVKEYLDKESEVEYGAMQPEQFQKMLDSNPEWTNGIMMELEEILCELETGTDSEKKEG